MAELVNRHEDKDRNDEIEQGTENAFNACEAKLSQNKMFQLNLFL
jgi:hypothetical protein